MGFSSVTRLLLLTGAAAVLASCGGGHSSSSSTSTANTPATITVSPTSLSLNHGDVSAIGSVQVLNSSNTAISPTPTITYSSANASAVTVTSSGQVCAGVFDANNIACQTKDSSGNPLPDTVVNITVSSGGLTTTVPVYVHSHVDNVKITATSSPVCLSQNQTQLFTAQAFSNGNDITSKVGPFTWSTGNSTVATVDQSGVVTSRQPGSTTVSATVTNTTGPPGPVVDCPPQNISLHASGSATTFNFSVASGTAQTLSADVTDIFGQPITGAPLTYSSFAPSTAAAASGGAITTPGAGTTTIVASCAPPGCNPGSQNVNGIGIGLPVYSNPFTGVVTGSTATTVYVTGSDGASGAANTSLIPITISTNAAGTAVTLAGSPNSMVFNRAGTKAYIGSTAGMLIFDPTSNTVTATAAGLTGTVLSVSNDGNEVFISDTANAKVFLYNAGANTSQEFDVPGVTQADFDADNTKAYLTAGSKVYEYSITTGAFKTLGFVADGVIFSPQESVAFFGGSSILGFAVCNDSNIPGVTTSAAANILNATPDGTHMIAAGTSGWADLKYTVDNSKGCPPIASNTAVNVTSGFGTGNSFVGTPTQTAVASDDSYAFLVGFSGGGTATGVPFYHFADGMTGAIGLTGGGGTLFSGSVTPDAKSLYVGVGVSGGTGVVHRIDLTPATGPADANQISVSFNPRIVVVRPQ